jgi:hypothetical protein
VQHLGACGVERLPRARHVRDRHVDRWHVAAGGEPYRRAHGAGEHGGRGELGEVRERLGRHGVEQPLGVDHRLVDPTDAAQRIGLVGRQGREDGRHPVGPLLGLLAAADRDRDHRHQRELGQLVVVLEPPPQSAGAHGHDDVVDGRTERVLDLLHRC